MAEEVATHCDYLPIIFRRCVAAVLGTHIHSDRSAFERVVMLAESHLEGLFSELAKICHVQRRQEPCLEDLSVLLAVKKINLFRLDSQRTLRSDLVDELNQLQFALELEPLAPEAIPFYDAAQNDMNLKAIVPSVHRMPPQVPKWMPPLPPDHTYMSTPQYTNRVRDLRQTREELVEEGRLAEMALQRLLGQSGSASIIELVPPEPEEAYIGQNDGVEVVDNSKHDLAMESDQVPADFHDGFTNGEPGLEPHDLSMMGDVPSVRDGVDTNMVDEHREDLPSVESHHNEGTQAENNAITNPDEAGTHIDGERDTQEETHATTGEDQNSAPKMGIKLKLNTPRKEEKAEPEQTTSKKGISLKLHIGPAKRPMKVENPFKKRPRVDIEDLAHKLSEEGKLLPVSNGHTENNGEMNGIENNTTENHKATEKRDDFAGAQATNKEDLGKLFEEALTSVS